MQAGLVYVKHNGSAPSQFRDWRGNGYVANLNRVEAQVLGDRLGLPVPAVQVAYEVMSTDDGQRELGKSYWHHDAEVFVKGKGVMTQPRLLGGSFAIEDVKKVKIDTNDALGTLEKAGLFKQTHGDVYRGGVYFEDENFPDLASVSLAIALPIGLCTKC